jgi:hypothetical protein
VKGVTRWLSSIGGKINEDGNVITQLAGIQKHALNVIHYDYLLTDRTVLDAYAYSVYLFQHDTINAAGFEEIGEIYRRYVKAYDHIFYFSPEFDIVLDGTRSTQISFRDEVKHIFDNLINKDGLYNIVPVTGTVEERLELILDVMKG